MFERGAKYIYMTKPLDITTPFWLIKHKLPHWQYQVCDCLQPPWFNYVSEGWSVVSQYCLKTE